MHPRVTADYLTFDGYLAIAGVSRRTLHRWLSHDQLPGAYKVNGRWRVPSDSVRTPKPNASTGGGDRGHGTTIPKWTIADRLRKARETAGLEQNELARAAGISRATISNAERGVVQPHGATVRVWAEACNVSASWIEQGRR
ncbi:helix-turn-helix domain-containing protein [Agromyces sp. NPDC056379]|uniref:helix-turn-helix domain-containing protein n=1 Tax=unclassified Agromyces TaxID=2639701 RepID=UPI0035DF6E88